jgi:hypothetical protein
MESGSESGSGVKRWRRQAARVVEELFAVTGPGEWDGLLELRRLVLTGGDWEEVLDFFLVCRERWERDHYLPFYRLRRLLEGHLRLVTGGGGEVGPARARRLELWCHRGMDDLRRRAQWETWDDGVVASPGRVRVEEVGEVG